MIIDTDVVVAAIRSDTGASAELIRRAVRGDIFTEVSVALALEYEAVATRAEHRAAGQKSLRDVMLVIDALIVNAKQVDVRFRWRPQLHDPDDEMVLEAAINAVERVIVTFNIKDFAAGMDKFGLRVVTPRQILEELR